MTDQKKHPAPPTQMHESTRAKREQIFEKKLRERNLQIMAEFYGVEFSENGNKLKP